MFFLSYSKNLNTTEHSFVSNQLFILIGLNVLLNVVA